MLCWKNGNGFHESVIGWKEEPGTHTRPANDDRSLAIQYSNNDLKKKATEYLCERPIKLICLSLQSSPLWSEYVDLQTLENIMQKSASCSLKNDSSPTKNTGWTAPRTTQHESDDEKWEILTC